MRRCIYRKTVHHRLDWVVFELPEVIRIVLLIHANDSAGTSGINAAEARIEFDNVGALGERQVRNRAARIQREHS